MCTLVMHGMLTLRPSRRRLAVTAGTSSTHKQHERSGRQGGRWFPLANGVRIKLNCPINGSSCNWIVSAGLTPHIRLHDAKDYLWKVYLGSHEFKVAFVATKLTVFVRSNCDYCRKFGL